MSSFLEFSHPRSTGANHTQAISNFSVATGRYAIAVFCYPITQFRAIPIHVSVRIDEEAAFGWHGGACMQTPLFCEGSVVPKAFTAIAGSRGLPACRAPAVRRISGSPHSP